MEQVRILVDDSGREFYILTVNGIEQPALYVDTDERVRGTKYDAENVRGTQISYGPGRSHH